MIKYAKCVFSEQEMFAAQNTMERRDISFLCFECQKPFALFETTFDIGEAKYLSQNQTFLFKNQNGN